MEKVWQAVVGLTIFFVLLYFRVRAALAYEKKRQAEKGTERTDVERK